MHLFQEIVLAHGLSFAL